MNLNKVSVISKGKIPELLSDDSDDLETRLVLVNTLYFKGRWHAEFETEDTREMPFKISPVSNIIQKFMPVG